MPPGGPRVQKNSSASARNDQIVSSSSQNVRTSHSASALDHSTSATLTAVDNTCNGSPEAENGCTLTYRQRRRLEAAQKISNGRTRGQSRALAAKRLRLKNPNLKPTATITKSMARIIGPNAASFIAECSNWVRHYCPLNSRNWARMDATAKQNLFDKIKGEWNLPTGSHVDRALKIQCSQLYRHWRYRLKEFHYVGKSVQEAINSRPSDVDQAAWRWLVIDYWGNEKVKDISTKNRENRCHQKLQSLNGALSTARILDDLRNAVQANVSNVRSTEVGDTASAVLDDELQEPEYIRLWVKTKKKKDGTWDEYAHAKFEEFKKLHADEIANHGVDNLTTEEAYAKVFRKSGSYITGLGAGARYPQNRKYDEEFNDERHSQLTQQIDHLQQESTNREASLRVEIDRMQADAKKREDEAREREAKLQQEVASIKDQLAQVLVALKASQMTN